LDDGQTGWNTWWGIGGTASTGSQFIGTTTAADLVLKVNNQQIAKFGHSTGTVAIGLDAGRFTLGGNNIFIGRRVSSINVIGLPLLGSNQIAIGDSALHFFRVTPPQIQPQTDGETYNLPNGSNIAIGSNAMQKQLQGGSNIAIGSNAMMAALSQYDINKAFNNVAIGYNALQNINAGYNNVVIGSNSGSGFINAYNVTAIGQLASVITGSTNIVDGNPAGYPIHSITLLGSNTSADFPNDNITVLGQFAKVEGTNGNRVDNMMAFGNDEVTKWAFGRSTTDPNRALQVGTDNTNGNGAYLTRTGTWTNVSDRFKKQDFLPVNNKDLLHKLSVLPITRWQYKAGPGWHIGPMAQDFKAIFQLGNEDNRTINSVDPAGIALAAIKVLLAETNELKARVTILETKTNK
jgi:hypothetical protein